MMSVVRLRQSVTFAAFSTSPSLPNVKPKLINDSDVRTQAISVRSEAMRVRSSASSVPVSASGLERSAGLMSRCTVLRAKKPATLSKPRTSIHRHRNRVESSNGHAAVQNVATQRFPASNRDQEVLDFPPVASRRSQPTVRNHHMLFRAGCCHRDHEEDRSDDSRQEG